MVDPVHLARWEEVFRPVVVLLPPPMAVSVYSWGRRRFLEALTAQRPETVEVPAGLAARLWGIDFRSPLGNAAGMFKNGEGYGLVAAQGAGFYLAGTTTASPRDGNRKDDHVQPFAPYPRSGAATNWLGLPNPGDVEVAKRLAAERRVAGCPLGVSLAAPPELTRDEDLEPAITALTRGLETYERAGVDFFEINESCPNTGAEACAGERDPGLAGLGRRLAALRRLYPRREKGRPLVIKLSCDTAPEQVPAILDLLFEHAIDGVNFGNTSIDYARHRAAIATPEQRLFDYFTSSFGGGVSGRPLKADSLRLASAAVEHRERARPGHEFHVVRTGGVESAADVRRSLDAGVSLVEWYSGYFEAFAAHGHRLYADLYAALVER